MPLTVTTVNGGAGRVVLGADGRPAHVIELGPLYIRIDLAGFDEVIVPARGGFAAVATDRPDMSPLVWRWRIAVTAQEGMHSPTQAALTAPDPPPGMQSFPDLAPGRDRRAVLALASTGNLALGVPA